MKTRLSKIAAILTLASATSAWAIPVLQLDILGGIYNTTTETTVATSTSFTLRALFKGTPTNDSYYVSAALSPGTTGPVPNFGSVLIDGTTYLPSDFVFGTPPVDVMDGTTGDLQTHGIFPTYYLEFEFSFAGAPSVGAYNVQTDATAPGVLYYHDFTINVGSLLPGYVLHFDLYHEGVKRGVYGVDYFAPFSKDAESGELIYVPDHGSALGFLAVGVALLAVWRRKSA